VREPLRSPAAPPAGLGWPQGGPPGCGHGFARLAEQREGEGGGREGQEERKEREGRKWRRGAREPLEKLTHQADCMRKTPNCAGEAPTRAADDEKFDDVALQLLPDCGGVPSSSSSSSSISSETSSIYKLSRPRQSSHCAGQESGPSKTAAPPANQRSNSGGSPKGVAYRAKYSAARQRHAVCTSSHFRSCQRSLTHIGNWQTDASYISTRMLSEAGKMAGPNKRRPPTSAMQADRARHLAWRLMGDASLLDRLTRQSNRCNCPRYPS